MIYKQHTPASPTDANASLENETLFRTTSGVDYASGNLSVYEPTPQLHSTSKYAELFSELLSKLMEQLPIIQAACYVFSPSQNEFLFCTGYAVTRAQMEHHFRLGEGELGIAAATQTVCRLALQDGATLTTYSALYFIKAQELTIVPCLHNGATWAVLAIYTSNCLTEAEVEVLQHRISTAVTQRISNNPS